MNDQAFAAAAERMALAKEIKRQEANLRALSEMIERKRARLQTLEREAASRDGLEAAMARVRAEAALQGEHFAAGRLLKAFAGVTP